MTSTEFSLFGAQVANELLTRTQRLLVVTAVGDGDGGASQFKELLRPKSDVDIERALVDEISSMHDAWRRAV